MKSVALASLVTIAAGSMSHGAVRATYRVTQVSPPLGEVRRIVLTRTRDRCLVWSVGATDDQLCAFSQQGTLLAERAGRLERFVPFEDGTMRAPEATGRVHFLPPIFGGFFTWEPLYEVPGNGQKVLFAIDVLSEKGSHIRQLAQVSSDVAGNITRVETMHNGISETVWEFANFRPAGQWRLPAEIKRQRFRSSGLNIPADDLVQWRLVEITTVPDSAVDDSHLFSNGAALTDLRPGSYGRTATYQRGKGALEDQWVDRPLIQPSQVPSPAWPKLLLGTCLGLVLSIVAVVRNRRQSVKEA